jgi:hypothetical protein
VTAPMNESDHRKLDNKLNIVLGITVVNLLLIIAAWIGWIDLVN